MNWFKLITKNGRRDLVRQAAKEYLSVGKIAELTSQGVNALLEKTCAGIDADKMAKVCGYCKDGASLFAEVSDAVADKQLTAQEVTDICAKVEALTGKIVTQERIDEIIEKIVEKVP